jgi:hypothetical protein
VDLQGKTGTIGFANVALVAFGCDGFQFGWRRDEHRSSRSYQVLALVCRWNYSENYQTMSLLGNSNC